MQTVPEPLTVPWRASPREAVLDEVARDDVHTAVWCRRLPVAVADYARRLVDEDVSLRLHGEPLPDPEGRSFLDRMPAGPGRDAFAADVAWSMRRYARVQAGRAFRAEVAAVKTDKCRRFHVDHYRLRWVCSYAGPGTEWLEDRDVVAEVLRDGPKGHQAFNRALLRCPERLRRLGPGDVLLMKGRGFPGPGFGGPLHRSPPVEATGLRRLVLTMTS